MHIGNKCCKKC